MKGCENIAHFVNCIYCKERFDRDKRPFVAVTSRRYAHKECYDRKQAEIEQEEIDKRNLEDYIVKYICPNDRMVTPRVRKQISTYINQNNYTYSGILKALIYFYEIKGNSYEKANGGIGIVPYIYDEAYRYYFAIWLANENNSKLQIKNYETKQSIIKIKAPKRNIKKRKRFSFLDEEEE